MVLAKEVMENMDENSCYMSVNHRLGPHMHFMLGLQSFVMKGDYGEI